MSTNFAGSDLRVVVRVLRESKRYGLHLVGVLFLGLLAAPIALVVPFPLKLLADSVVGQQPIPGWLDALLPGGAMPNRNSMLAVLAAVVIVVALMTQLQAYGTFFLQSYVNERVVLAFQSRLFARAQRLSLQHHDSVGGTDTLYRIHNDARQLQFLLTDGVLPLLSSALTLVAMLYVTWRLDARLCLIALSIVPVQLLLAWLFRRSVLDRWGEAKRLESQSLSVIQEVLASLRVVKAFGQEDRETNRFEKVARGSSTARIQLFGAEAIFGIAIGLTTAFGTAFVLYVGARHVAAGSLTLGELLLVLGYLAQLYDPLQAISKRMAKLQSAIASTKRSFELLDAPTEVLETKTPKRLVLADGGLRFENVSFAYETGRPALQSVSFAIESGTSLGIMGTTGAGKSTILNLLMRFYEPDSGRVLLDGTDIREYRLRDLRRQFALVLQDPLLFSTSIGDNISYADPHATREDVILAARAANVHRFIARLPDGYDTIVGERGAMLSGGERQRISLARAFLVDAPIIALDEPTSSVDSGTEELIMDAMARLMTDRTVIMIAHRLSTLACCDARIRIEQGEIVATSGRVELPHPTPPLVIDLRGHQPGEEGPGSIPRDHIKVHGTT